MERWLLKEEITYDRTDHMLGRLCAVTDLKGSKETRADITRYMPAYPEPWAPPKVLTVDEQAAAAEATKLAATARTGAAVGVGAPKATIIKSDGTVVGPNYKDNPVRSVRDVKILRTADPLMPCPK